jgi:hypothetical protein
MKNSLRWVAADQLIVSLTRILDAVRSLGRVGLAYAAVVATVHASARVWSVFGGSAKVGDTLYLTSIMIGLPISAAAAVVEAVAQILCLWVGSLGNMSTSGQEVSSLLSVLGGLLSWGLFFSAAALQVTVTRRVMRYYRDNKSRRVEP